MAAFLGGGVPLRRSWHCGRGCATFSPTVPVAHRQPTTSHQLSTSVGGAPKWLAALRPAAAFHGGSGRGGRTACDPPLPHASCCRPVIRRVNGPAHVRRSIRCAEDVRPRSCRSQPGHRRACDPVGPAERVCGPVSQAGTRPKYCRTDARREPVDSRSQHQAALAVPRVQPATQGHLARQVL